jgi:seryl-tRNA(Sec) selenium transferase
VIAALDADVFNAGFTARLTGAYPLCATSRALRKFDDASGDEARERVQSLLTKRKDQLGQIRRQMRLKALLEVWLFIHIPTTIALIAALTAHIISVFYYW